MFQLYRKSYIGRQVETPLKIKYGITKAVCKHEKYYCLSGSNALNKTGCHFYSVPHLLSLHIFLYNHGIGNKDDTRVNVRKKKKKSSALVKIQTQETLQCTQPNS